MTGLECLKEELRKRGCNTNQINSTVVPKVLDILSGGGSDFFDKSCLAEEVQELEMRKYNLQQDIKRMEARLAFVIADYERVRKEEWINAPDYIEKWYQAIRECETPEGRDALRAAQMFINSIAVDTKYDNTAFIIGLASIISRGNIAAISELRKINQRIPNPDFERSDMHF